MSTGMSLIQSAISRPAVSVAPPKGSAPVGVRTRVEVVVLASAGAPAAVEPEKGHFHLAPGNTFSVRVLLSPASQDEAGAVELTEAEPLSLVWEGAAGIQVQRETASVVLAELNSLQSTREFWLKTEPGAAGVQGRLSLRRGSLGTQEVRALELHVEAELAAVWSLTEELREKVRVDLDTAPKDPEATAFLHIESTDQQLRLHWFPVKAGSSGKLVVPEPSRNLLDPLGKPNTEKIFDNVRTFFRRTCGQLRRWLEDRVKARKEVTLIIQECAETRVPWEMLELPFQKEQELAIEFVPIGALIKVVRWLSTVDSIKGEEIPLRLDRKDWSGQAISYVAAAELKHAAQEMNALKGWHESFDDVEKLGKSLRKVSKPLAMLFVASHGQLQEGEPDPNASEPALTRIARNLPMYPQHARPLAFINACHSGLLQRDDLGIAGLPEKFLGTFAGAYLGVMGRIDESIAAAIGARILEAAKGKDGVCIPELLRQVRREAFEKLDAGDNASRRAYVYKFMYVFYGTPEAYLKLEPAGGSNG